MIVTSTVRTCVKDAGVFAAAGWVPALAVTFGLAVLTSYSGSLFSRLYQAVPTAGARGVVVRVDLAVWRTPGGA